MIVHFNTSSHLVALYEPKEIIKNDSWLNPFGQISERLDEIFGGSFDKYVNEHIEEIKKCYATIIELL
jgi:hypothetical protein